MTREEILAMVPGPELDAAVAEKKFGYWWADGPEYDCDGPCEWERILVPPTMTKKQYDNYLFPPRGKISKTYFVNKRFSTDIAAAWEVVEKVKTKLKIFTYFDKEDGFADGWMVKIGCDCVTCDTTPEAICKAALLDVMGVE